MVRYIVSPDCFYLQSKYGKINAYYQTHEEKEKKKRYCCSTGNSINMYN